MPTYRLDLEYHGARYRGWQAQKNAETVANVLERACRKVFKDFRELHGAGRTDAGVHALGQVAHVRAGKPLDRKLKPRLALNDALPSDIAVTGLGEVGDNFHARYSATQRVYLYQILRRRAALGTDLAWWVKDALDVKAMRQAAEALAGEHDFKAFSDADPEKPKTTVIDLAPLEVVEDGALLLLRFRAQNFLWKMVRRLSGYLVEVGRGRYKAGLTPAMFSQSSSVLAPFTAPPQGLFLERVLYGKEGFEQPARAVLGLPA